MYDRMVHEHGYSIRKLAEKLGKDKGYLENRLRLADAPPEIRELVSLRKDTLSHAYELMKVEDPKKRRRLAEQVARGELTLVKLRDKIEGRRPREAAADDRDRRADDAAIARAGRRRRRAETDGGCGPPTASRPARRSRDDSLVNAKQSLADAVEELVGVLAQRRGPRLDRRDRPGEPGQVPDDRQAPARERDRDGPERRRRRLSPSGGSAAGGDARPATPRPAAPTPTASSSHARSRRAGAARSADADAGDDAATAAATAADQDGSGGDRAATASAAAHATTTTATSSAACDRPRPLAARARSPPKSTPAAASRSTSARALAIASAAPASTAAGDEDRERRGSAAGRPEPGEDGQQRDPDRERQPRPGRPLEREVVARTRSPGRRPPGPSVAGPDGAARTSPSAAATTTTTTRRRAGETRPAGIGLPRLAAGVTRRIDQVVERPDRGLQGRHRDAEPERRRGIGAGDDRDGGHDDAVEEGRERMGQPDQAADDAPAGPGRPSARPRQT